MSVIFRDLGAWPASRFPREVRAVPARYLAGKPNFGATVGRCANRIRGGACEIDGVTLQLDVNNGPNHLHGGTDGFWGKAALPGDELFHLRMTETSR